MDAQQGFLATSIDQLVTIFHQLQGTWILHRELQSTNSAEPSGKCSGQATFTAREPSVFVDQDGKLQKADEELVYHEHGQFELYQSMPGSQTVPRFAFSRKYIWRLQNSSSDQPPTLSVWFTKPGTETIDYLFHKVDVQSDNLESDTKLSTGHCVQGNGCHLCEEDLYSSNYSFQLYNPKSNRDDARDQPLQLQNWMMVHEVRGPNKDQYIETKFLRG